MAPLRVLIVGGGVAGTSLAFWLTRLGHAVTLVERYPGLRTTGLQIDLRGHGIEAMRRMGLEQAFRDKAAPEEGLQFIDLKGRNRAYFPANRSGDGPQSFTSEFEIMRGDLCRLIHDATDGKAAYVFGTTVASYQETEDCIDVSFENGDKRQFDLLVGSDGIFSNTRKMMLGADAEKALRPIGETNAYMTFHMPVEKAERYVGQMYLATERRAILLRRHKADEMQLYLLLNRDDDRLKVVKRGDVEAEKAAFADIYAGAGWKMPELLQSLKTADDFYCERLAVVKMDSWHKGRVVLVGDAGYATGGSGMGSTCAIVGSYVLAAEIAKHCGRGDAAEADPRTNLTKALTAYETTLRPFMDSVPAAEDNPMQWLMPTSTFGIAILHLMLELLTFVWTDPLARWLTVERAGKWQLPTYPEMPSVGAESVDVA